MADYLPNPSMECTMFKKFATKYFPLKPERNKKKAIFYQLKGMYRQVLTKGLVTLLSMLIYSILRNCVLIKVKTVVCR